MAVKQNNNNTKERNTEVQNTKSIFLQIYFFWPDKPIVVFYSQLTIIVILMYLINSTSTEVFTCRKQSSLLLKNKGFPLIYLNYAICRTLSLY